MLKIAGALWIIAIAFYGTLTVNQNSPELGFWFDLIGGIVGIGLLIKWAR